MTQLIVAPETVMPEAETEEMLGGVVSEGGVATMVAGSIESAVSIQTSLPIDQFIVTDGAPALVEAPMLLQAKRLFTFRDATVVWFEELTDVPSQTKSATTSPETLSTVTEATVLNPLFEA